MNILKSENKKRRVYLSTYSNRNYPFHYVVSQVIEEPEYDLKDWHFKYKKDAIAKYEELTLENRGIK